MKISILSDLHLDFWSNPNNSDYYRLWKALDQCLDGSEEVEVLIVAGDLTHEPSQLYILDKIAARYHYKKIFCVLGNHDLYLNTPKLCESYKDSKNKAKAYFSYKSDVVTILDGNIVKYRGITFGGTMAFYDGSFTSGISAKRNNPITYWKECMNDAYYIKGYQDFYEIFEEERPKIEAILEADIIITHVCPSTKFDAFQDIYRYVEMNMFFSFDGKEYLQRTNAKYWIYGHSHGQNIFEEYGVKCLMNTLGYPKEHTLKKMTIEVYEKRICP